MREDMILLSLDNPTLVITCASDVLPLGAGDGSETSAVSSFSLDQIRFSGIKKGRGIFFLETANRATSVSDLIPMDGLGHLNVSGNERVWAKLAAWLEN